MSVPPLLDETDLEILRFLSSNARLKYKQIGSKIGKPVSTVFKRVERLRRLGVIRGFTVILDRTKLNYTILAVALMNVDLKFLNELVNQIVDNPNILQIYFTALHEYSVVWFGVFKDVDELNNLMESLKALNYVREVKVIILTKIIKEEINPRF